MPKKFLWGQARQLVGYCEGKNRTTLTVNYLNILQDYDYNLWKYIEAHKNYN
jgi:hypothetical protein